MLQKWEVNISLLGRLARRQTLLDPMVLYRNFVIAIAKYPFDFFTSLLLLMILSLLNHLNHLFCSVFYIVFQDSHCIPGGLPDSLTKLYELYDSIETFVMFIGYPRSSHSLVGAILDAHPEIIIPHEYHIVGQWNIYLEHALRNSGMQKYLLFYNLHSLSTWQASFGSRARKPVFLDDGIYSYNVPGAWQGTFNGKLKVSASNCLII